MIATKVSFALLKMPSLIDKRFYGCLQRAAQISKLHHDNDVNLLSSKMFIVKRTVSVKLVDSIFNYIRFPE